MAFVPPGQDVLFTGILGGFPERQAMLRKRKEASMQHVPAPRKDALAQCRIGIQPVSLEPRDEPSRIRPFAIRIADSLSIKEDDLVPGRNRPVDPEIGWKPILHCFPERRA
jgi:hypothetical protein